MTFKATEGNGGAPVVVARAPVERPAEIRRGIFLVPHRSYHIADYTRVTFTKQVPGFDITYHDCQVTGTNLGSIVVFVSSRDAVTWAKRD